MNDRGSIVLGWLTKLVMVTAAFGLIAFDGVAVVAVHFTAADHATSAALAAADAFHSNHDGQASYQAAVASLPLGTDTIDPKSFQISPSGQVTLVLHSTATTLWLFRVHPLQKYAVATATGVGSPRP